MREFDYLAVDKGGNFVHGALEARDQDLAYQQLRRIFPFILSLKEHSFGMRRKVSPQAELRIPPETFAVYIRQLATLIASGVQVSRALLVLAEGEHMGLNIVMLRMYSKVIAGSSLSRAMRENPSVFSEIFVSVVEIGEVSGKLEMMLNRLADLHETNWRMRRRIMATMTYPAMLAAASILLLGVFIFVIFPMIQPVFLTLGGELPMLTRLIIFGIAAMQSPWLLVPLLLIGGGLALLFRFRRFLGFLPRGIRLAVDRWILRVPVLGSLIEKTTASRVMYSLATMLDAGVHLGEALKSINNVVSNEFLLRRFTLVWSAVVEGSSINVAMTRHKAFPPWVVQMVKVGEESGTVDAMLKRVAIVYQGEVEYFLENLSSALEPLMLCVMGVVVGVVTVGTFLPVIQLLNEI